MTKYVLQIETNTPIEIPSYIYILKINFFFFGQMLVLLIEYYGQY
jgi:hypothetical protein